MDVQNKSKKIWMGSVISDKMDKTVVVKSEMTYTHPRFHKVLRKVKKYKVHDENELANVGDIIEFYQGRPIAKTKYMYLHRVVKSQAKE